jgi:hypothetical protein
VPQISEKIPVGAGLPGIRRKSGAIGAAVSIRTSSDCDSGNLRERRLQADPMHAPRVEQPVEHSASLLGILLGWHNAAPIGMSLVGQKRSTRRLRHVSAMTPTPDVNQRFQLTIRLAFLFGPCGDIPCIWRDRFWGPIALAALSSDPGAVTSGASNFGQSLTRLFHNDQ